MRKLLTLSGPVVFQQPLQSPIGQNVPLVLAKRTEGALIAGVADACDSLPR